MSMLCPLCRFLLLLIKNSLNPFFTMFGQDKSMEMDTAESYEDIKRCFKLPAQVFDKLNVLYNPTNSMMVFWNKYQIFVYENSIYDEIAITMHPDFMIHRMMVSNNYIVCLDCSGNIHTTSLKFKSPARKRFKRSFQTRETGIATFTQLNQDYCFTIKLENGSSFVCLHRISADFQTCNKVLLKYDSSHLPLHKLQDKCILTCCSVPTTQIDYLRDLFNVDLGIGKEGYSLQIVTFDSKTVYGYLLNQRCMGDEVSVLKLYQSPSEIGSIQILEKESINVLVSLKSGSVIRLVFESGRRKPEVIHLNVAIHKIHAFNDSLIFTDGNTMWRTDSTYSPTEIKFKQLFIKLTRDFVVNADQIVCVTFSNNIYLFPIDNESAYVKTDEKPYTPVEKLLEKPKQNDKVNEELLKCLEISKKAQLESNYIATIALSNRQDLMDEAIQYSVLTYENYEDVISENSDIQLTDELRNYFEPESTLFLVKVLVTEQHKLSPVFTSLLDNLKLHITLSTDGHILKTVSIAIRETIKKMNLLLPLKSNCISNVTIKIKMVPGIPGALDINQTFWIILSQKEITLNSEHFIRHNSLKQTIIAHLKNPQQTIEELVLESASQLHGPLFSFHKDTNSKTEIQEWSYYVRLPENHVNRLNSKETYTKYFSAAKSEAMLKMLSSNEFLEGKNHLIFQVGKYKVKVEVIKDESSGSLLRVTSANASIAQSIREFLSGILYGEYENYEPAKEFIHQSQYAVIEDIQRSLKTCLTSRKPDLDIILDLDEKFQRNVIGALPL